jgi:hypothetical protein
VKIKTSVASYGPQLGKTHAFVDVTVDFESSKEMATFRVLVPDGDGEMDARELAVARARDLGAQVCGCPSIGSVRDVAEVRSGRLASLRLPAKAGLFLVGDTSRTQAGVMPAQPGSAGAGRHPGGWDHHQCLCRATA